MASGASYHDFRVLGRSEYAWSPWERRCRRGQVGCLVACLLGLQLELLLSPGMTPCIPSLKGSELWAPVLKVVLHTRGT